MPDATTAPPPAAALCPGQAGRLVVLSLVLWAVAAAGIHAAIPAGWFQGLPLVALYVASLPLAWGCLNLVRRIGRLRPGQGAAAMLAALFPAMLCDGLALAFWPAIYGPPGAPLAAAAGWLLWGLAWCMLAALRAGRAT